MNNGKHTTGANTMRSLILDIRDALSVRLITLGFFGGMIVSMFTVFGS